MTVIFVKSAYNLYADRPGSRIIQREQSYEALTVYAIFVSFNSDHILLMWRCVKKLTFFLLYFLKKKKIGIFHRHGYGLQPWLSELIKVVSAF